MNCRIILEEMILTGIAWYFQLSSDSHGTVQLFAYFYALVDLLIVFLEIQRVIVQTADSYFHLKSMRLHGDE